MSDETDQPQPTRAELEARLADERRELAELADRPFETTGDPDGEPIPPLEDDEPEGQLSPIAQVHGAYLQAVMEVLGADASVVPCGSCGGYGFKEFELPNDPHTETCPDCQGWGEVLTGSSVAGQVKRHCPRCQSKGWVPLGTVTALVPDGNRPPAPPGFYYDPAGSLVPLVLNS